MTAENDRRPAETTARFLAACKAVDLETMRTLLATDPGLARTEDLAAQYGGWTALHTLARDGHLEAVRLLLANGADPNAREAGDNTTPLHWAVAHRHVDVVEALLNAGSDPHGGGDLHELDAIGWATYFYPPGGRRGEQRGCADLLVARGARHHVFSAISLGDLDLLRRVVEHDHGALDRRMSRFEKRLTPLHFAMAVKRPDMLDLLIAVGADVEATDGNGLTPLEAAMLAGDAESVRRLQAAGARAPQTPTPAATNLAPFAEETKRITAMLRVPDVRRALEWYVSLGFSERGRYEESGLVYWAMVGLGDAELMLNMGKAVDDPPVALWVYVTHVKPVYDMLKARQLHAAQTAAAHRIEFAQHLYEPPYGGWEFAIRDPNGFTLNFLGPT